MVILYACHDGFALGLAAALRPIRVMNVHGADRRGERRQASAGGTRSPLLATHLVDIAAYTCDL